MLQWGLQILIKKSFLQFFSSGLEPRAIFCQFLNQEIIIGTKRENYNACGSRPKT